MSAQPAALLDRHLSRESTGNRGRNLIFLLIALYPVWWVLGLGSWIIQLIAIPMAVSLIRRRRAVVPLAFGWWLLFLLWVGGSLLLLGVNPAGVVADPASSRLLVAVFRVSQYLALTIILLYVVNDSGRKPRAERLSWLLGLLFVYTVAGGLLGVVWPTFSFTSPVEFLLPDGLRSNPWIASMVHPSAAQVQDFLGYDLGRPAAPFGYTNMWGANLALLLPWFVASWVVRPTGGRRLLGVLVLVAAVIPVVWSVNRGLWIALGLAAALTVIQLARSGMHGALVPLAAAGALVVATVLMSPLGALISERLDNPQSNRIREFTTERAIDTIAASPIVGFGSTRDALGSAQSIAVSQSPDCMNCGNTPLGQNGQLWLVLICQGIAGAALFYGMFLTNLIRYRRPSTLLVGAGWVSVALGMVMTLYYDMMVTPMLMLILSLAALTLAARESSSS